MSALPPHTADLLMDAVSRALTTDSEQEALRQSKRAVAALWRVLGPSERAAFVRTLDPENGYRFLEAKPKWPDLEDATLEAAARVWPLVRMEVGKSDQDFANDVHTRLRWPNWTPSEKQREWMKRLYRQWKAGRG